MSVSHSFGYGLWKFYFQIGLWYRNLWRVRIRIRLLKSFSLVTGCWILGSINTSKKLIHLCLVMIDNIFTSLHRLLWFMNIKNVLFTGRRCAAEREKQTNTGLLRVWEVPMGKPLMGLFLFDCYCMFSLKEHFQFAFLIVYV